MTAAEDSASENLERLATALPYRFLRNCATYLQETRSPRTPSIRRQDAGASRCFSHLAASRRRTGADAPSGFRAIRDHVKRASAQSTSECDRINALADDQCWTEDVDRALCLRSCASECCPSVRRSIPKQRMAFVA
jgi:hypothetical protein